MIDYQVVFIETYDELIRLFPETNINKINFELLH